MSKTAETDRLLSEIIPRMTGPKSKARALRHAIAIAWQVYNGPEVLLRFDEDQRHEFDSIISGISVVSGMTTEQIVLRALREYSPGPFVAELIIERPGSLLEEDSEDQTTEAEVRQAD